MNAQGLTFKQLASLFDQLDGAGLHTKAPAAYHTGMLLDQPGGLFNVAGLENEVISTHVTPQGLGSAMPAYANNVDDPRYGFILGWQKANGSQPVNPCDDAPKSFIKGGTLTAQFGRIAAQSNTIEVDRILHQARESSTNLQLIGSMIGMDTLAGGQFPQNPLNAVIAAEMVGMGVTLERELAPMLWTGTPANNTAGNGYREFPGLDNQIVTGHVDAETNTAMPAADSIVLDFNYNYVDGTGLDIVEYLSAVEYELYSLARRTGVAPVTWYIVMRPELWQYLTMVWPCRYNTNRCSTNDGTNPVVINDDANIRMRDAMRQGMYIDINGRRYRVVEDDGIYEQTNANDENVPAGSFASSLYFVPMQIRGSMPSLYWEYIDYRRVRTELAPMGNGSRFVPFWTDSGRFLWTTDYLRYCLDLMTKIEPRAVLRTPHLAAKLQNIMYTPLIHTRSWDPDSPYWKDGGVSLRTASTSYAVWN